MTTVQKFRKKPVVIEAMHVTRDSRQDVAAWILDGGGDVEVMSPYLMRQGGIETTHAFQVKTLEGFMWVKYGDFLIKGIQGEFYPRKPDIFAQTYDAAEPAA